MQRLWVQQLPGLQAKHLPCPSLPAITAGADKAVNHWGCSFKWH